MRDWLILISAGALTYLTRASFLLLGDRLELPAAVRRALRYVAPAAFAGITVPAVVGGNLASVELSSALAASVAMVVVWKTRSVVLCMLIGMSVLWLGQWLGL